ncbi:hypothetical protein NDU88_007387 [Pleurodeles waltl]|uniref:Uncharacterized protein n=1 Tax=Pleurodeles waltl TaxID=8319 RepID=A0AAV7SSC1_PLEWA|nr:hypothetical protein NDU88_007387 [Pleurodeles waltl]
MLGYCSALDPKTEELNMRLATRHSPPCEAARALRRPVAERRARPVSGLRHGKRTWIWGLTARRLRRAVGVASACRLEQAVKEVLPWEAGSAVSSGCGPRASAAPTALWRTVAGPCGLKWRGLIHLWRRRDWRPAAGPGLRAACLTVGAPWIWRSCSLPLVRGALGSAL